MTGHDWEREERPGSTDLWECRRCACWVFSLADPVAVDGEVHVEYLDGVRCSTSVYADCDVEIVREALGS